MIGLTRQPKPLLALALVVGGCGDATNRPGGGDELGFVLSWPVVDSISIDPTAAPEVREIRTWGLDAEGTIAQLHTP